MYFERTIIFVILSLTLAGSVLAQSSSFNYQGRLSETGAAASASFQFQFKLYDAPNGGNQIGSTLSDVAVNVSNGTFSVGLDFGAQAFSGGDRYLEVAVRKTANDSYTTLTPRQKINSAPYSNRANSANTADNFNGNLSGDVTGTQNSTVVSAVGGKTSAEISTSVSETNNATSAGTANTIVKRDANGRFAAMGITFGDGTTLTTANTGGGNLLGSTNNWTAPNTFSNGISLNNTNITNVANPINGGDATNKQYVDANTIKFVPGNTPQLSIGDANGTAPMINLRGQSTCCGQTAGFADFKVF